MNLFLLRGITWTTTLLWPYHLQTILLNKFVRDHKYTY